MSFQRLVNSCLPVLDLSEGKGSSTKSESSDPEGVLVSSQFSGIIDLFLSTSGAFGSCKYSGRSICPFCFPKNCRNILTFHIAFLIIFMIEFPYILKSTNLCCGVFSFWYFSSLQHRLLLLHNRVLCSDALHPCCPYKRQSFWSVISSLLYYEGKNVSPQNTNNFYITSVEICFF